MKRRKEIALFILIGLLSFALSAQSIAHSKPKSISLGEITATPTLRSFSPFEAESPDVRAITALTQAYFEARYRGLSTLRLEGFEAFLASSPEAARFWESESAKLAVDLKHAELNQLRYVEYEFSLEYVSVQIDPKAQRATIALEEKGKVVYELSARLDPQNPIVSSHSLRHIIQLAKENGQWKILSDTYTDYLWRIMQETGITPEQLLATMRPAPLPSRMKQQGSFSCPLAPDESAHDYNREGAVNYALKYAESPNNLNYYYFSADEQLGGDCTNFVSQAIYEGGKASMSIPPTPEQGIGGTRWYYFDVNNRARAWTYVDGLYDFITHPYAWSEGPEGCEVSIDQITIGDVIQYETDGDNTWDHAVIVVEIQDGIPYVASHSPNFSKEPYTSFSYSDIRFIHVERLDIAGPRGFEANGILASYYNDTSTPFELDGPITWDTFTNYVLSRRESHVDFMIGDADVPPPGVNDTFWSARWEGALYVPQDGEYTFYLKNLDDGGKLYLDNLTTPVLESWKVQGFHTYSTKVPLTAGAHIVRVEFAQGPPLDYGLIVEWESDDFREKIGPYSGITSTPTPTPTATPTQTPTPVPSATSTLPPTATLIPTATPWWGWWVEAEEAALQEEPPMVRQEYSTLLSRVRDEIMLPDPKGDAYIRLVYRHAPEITALLLNDASIRQDTRTLMLEVRPLLEEMLANKTDGMRLSADWVKRALALLGRVEKKASPELKREIMWWRTWLPRFAGKNGKEIWEMLPQRDAGKIPQTAGSPEELVLQSIPAEEARAFGRLLSRVRDEVMRGDKGGEVYIALVYRCTPEVTALLLNDENLRQQAETLLLEAKPGIQSLLGETKKEWVFSSGWLKRMDGLLASLQTKATPELRAELAIWRTRLPEWEDKTPSQVWEALRLTANSMTVTAPTSTSTVTPTAIP